MSSTDSTGPRSFEPRRTRSRGLSSCLPILPATILFLAGAFSATVSRAQDQPSQQNQSVADAARQQHARKDQQQKNAKHVYTEEDLKRARILTPEDQAKVEARKTECAQKNNCGPAPQQNSPAPLDANSQQPQQPSLGEVARQYRKQKELDALKPKQTEPFHLPVADPALASPVVPGNSVVSPSSPGVDPAKRAHQFRRAAPRTSSASNVDARGRTAREAMTSSPTLPLTQPSVSRRDPFAPTFSRPRVPLAGASGLRPAIRPPAHVIPQSAPKIAATPNRPTHLVVTPPQPAPIGPHVLSSPTTSARTFRMQPVRPSVPPHQRATVSAPSANIFPSLKGAPPLMRTPAPKPAQPVDRSSPEHLFAGATGISPALSGAASSPASAPPSAGRIIRVQPGDSLWKLARNHFGRGSLWPQIRAANPSIGDPNRLRPGAGLLLPVLPVGANTLQTAQGQPGHPGSGSERTVLVHHGDTLWSLAHIHLGASSNWACLAAANPQIADPNRIFVGQEISIPATCELAYRP